MCWGITCLWEKTGRVYVVGGCGSVRENPPQTAATPSFVENSRSWKTRFGLCQSVIGLGIYLAVKTSLRRAALRFFSSEFRANGVRQRL